MRIALLLCLLFIGPYGATGQIQSERLKLDWPDEYNFKVGSNQENETQQLIELIPEKETLENWTMMGSMMSIKNVRNVPMDKAMEMMFSQAKQASDHTKLTFIEKDDKALNPWVLFKIETADYKDSPNPESQVYYIVQGRRALYINMIALKKKELPKDFVDTWSGIFKKAEVVE